MEHIDIRDYLEGDRLNHSIQCCSHLETVLGRGLTIEEHQAVELHDIGYSPRCVSTGFHPLDGALYLAATSQFSDTQLYAILMHSDAEELVKYQSETTQALFHDVLKTINKDNSILELVTLADGITDGKGKLVTPQERVADISKRYGEDNYITQIAIKSFYPLIDKWIK